MSCCCEEKYIVVHREFEFDLSEGPGPQSVELIGPYGYLAVSGGYQMSPGDSDLSLYSSHPSQVNSSHLTSWAFSFYYSSTGEGTAVINLWAVFVKNCKGAEQHEFTEYELA
jgi:hypothetical protein